VGAEAVEGAVGDAVHVARGGDDGRRAEGLVTEGVEDEALRSTGGDEAPSQKRNVSAAPTKRATG